MTKRVAVYGGSFNPPGLHHRRVVESIAPHFDEVIVVPCGPRPDKPSVTEVDPIYRAAMADIGFARLPKTTVELFDLEHATFTRTHALEEIFRVRGEVWHVVGGDLVGGGARGESFIQKTWENGVELWNSARFVVVTRPGHHIDRADLPPASMIVELDSHASSTAIRDLRYNRKPIRNLVTNEIESYVERHNLYRVSLPTRMSKLPFASPRLAVFVDERNPRAVEWKKRLAPFEHDDPTAIAVVGGDGTMLRAIQQHWRRRLPFFGINAGHLGFLLNDITEDRFPPKELISRQLPLLYVEVKDRDGNITSGLAFNDAWVERATGQTAWIELAIDGKTRLKKIVCDGILLATAAGSTAYARAMGATPLLADTPAWLVVGSNVMHPASFKSALLSPEAQVEIKVLESEKRPVNAFLWGTPFGSAIEMSARISRIAAAEVAFVPEHDMAEKIARVQFPEGV